LLVFFYLKNIKVFFQQKTNEHNDLTLFLAFSDGSEFSVCVPNGNISLKPALALILHTVTGYPTAPNLALAAVTKTSRMDLWSATMNDYMAQTSGQIRIKALLDK
jgi:hypothetical protein